ncbi:lysozyme inhibitor LprI family protein [Gemmobacter denitrificans]|uniref:Lysozyme inhibitor LprI family protein n=1 Tax=Gemmobacter denitrificans TaxID=3123040 RepID=A0ABU8BPU3_9RHOB
MRLIPAALICLAPLTLPAFAQQVDCTNASSQNEMTFCAEQDWMAADADLNAAYKAARDRMRAVDADLPKDQQGAEAQLKQAQRAWVTFRDAACAAEGYMMHGGSAEPMVIYGCRAFLTRQRAEGLWGLADFEG